MTAVATKVPAPPLDLQPRLSGQADALSMMPKVAEKALDIARDPSRGIADFAAVIEQDIGLTSRILRLANSAMFAPPKPITSLHQAVVRLGVKQCKSLIMAASVSSMMNRLSDDQVCVREQLWKHSFFTGVVAVHMARGLGLSFSGEEFTAGLMHDMGRTLLAIAAPERFREADPLDFDETGDVLSRERAIFQTDHCEFGAWYASRNQLPAELVSVIWHHHHPEEAAEHRALVLLTAAADHVANYLQRSLGGAPYDAGTNRAVSMLEAAGHPQAHERFRTLAPQLMEGAVHDAMELMKLAA